MKTQAITFRELLIVFMQRRTKISFILLFLLAISPISRAGFSIYTGGNFSAQQPGFSNFKAGKVLGLQKNWGSSKLSFATGLIYSAKGGILKNKNFAFTHSESGYHQDIHVWADYLEIPFFLKHFHPGFKKVQLGFYLGPSLAIAIADHSESKNSTYFYFSELAEPVHIDYWENIEPNPVWAECSMACLNLGLIVKYSKFFIEMRYNHPLGEMKTVARKNIHEKFHSLNFLFGVTAF